LADPPEALVALCQDLLKRVKILEHRLAPKRPDATGRLRTRRDRTPYGWKPNPPDPKWLIQDVQEQATISMLVELAQDPRASLRDLCIYLDQRGRRRRGGGLWRGHHGTVRAILRREGIFRPVDAKVAVLRRLANDLLRAAATECRSKIAALLRSQAAQLREQAEAAIQEAEKCADSQAAAQTPSPPATAGN